MRITVWTELLASRTRDPFKNFDVSGGASTDRMLRVNLGVHKIAISNAFTMND